MAKTSFSSLRVMESVLAACAPVTSSTGRLLLSGVRAMIPLGA